MQNSNIPYVDIVESKPRNTAAGIAFATFTTAAEAILLVTPSNHIIEDDVA